MHQVFSENLHHGRGRGWTSEILNYSKSCFSSNIQHDLYSKNPCDGTGNIHIHLPPSSNIFILRSSGHWFHKALLVQPEDSNSQGTADVFQSSWLLQMTRGDTEDEELHRDSGFLLMLHLFQVCISVLTGTTDFPKRVLLLSN